MNTVIKASILTALTLSGTVSRTIAAPIMSLYVFGASYNDNGNGYALIGAPQSPPYDQRYSNGPVYIEYVARNLGITLTNSLSPSATGTASIDFAVSGALTGTGNTTAALSGTTGMLNQVADFQGRLASGAIVFNPSSTLFVLSGGINDVIGGTLSGQSSAQTVATATANIRSEVITLTGLGAKCVAITTIPKVGRTPVGPATGLATTLTATSDALNASYKALSPQLSASTGADVFGLNQGGYVDQLIADPTAFGLSNSTTPCVTGTAPNYAVCSDPSQYVFWDVLHPTTAADQIVGNLVTAELATDVPEPTTLIVLLTALASLGLIRRRFRIRRPGSAGYPAWLRDREAMQLGHLNRGTLIGSQG